MKTFRVSFLVETTRSDDEIVESSIRDALDTVPTEPYLDFFDFECELESEEADFESLA